MRQSFFETPDVRPLQGRPWTPLRQSTEQAFHPPDAGVTHVEEFVGIGSLAVYGAKRAVADALGWSDLGLNEHRSAVERTGYHPADLLIDWRSGEPIGVNLVIDQFLEQERRHVWHLHPDLVVALHLIREGDSWFRPEEGWVEVARLRHDDEGEPVLLEMRTEFLADYLVARDMSLFASSYYERTALMVAQPDYAWSKDGYQAESGREAREARVAKDDYGDDPSVFRVMGALWRTEWVEPGTLSRRVRGDKDPNPIAFAAEADGTRQAPAQLHGAMAWLYFEPNLVLTLLRHRGARLGWYSQETGLLGATRHGVHFGVNALGLINIFAKDIGKLDAWEQRLWSAHNVTPEGGVSRELFAAQMEVQPAATKAPEYELPAVLAALDATFAGTFGAPMLRENDAVPKLLARAHRFRAAEQDGLLALSKDLTRLFAERVDVDAVASAAGLKLGEKKPNSLKAVEKLLATRIGESDARAIMVPLFGILDLRLSDAHLGTGLIASGLERAGVDEAQPSAMQGRQLIQGFVAGLRAISSTMMAGVDGASA